MRSLRWTSVLLALLGAVACSAYRLAGQVQSGRQALLINNPEAALGYFAQAAVQDPRYVATYSLFPQSVWTYLGRSQYLTGKLTEARQSLQQALDRVRQDHMARLFLGLTLARSGDSSQAVKEIAAGMRGLYDWIDYTAAHRLTLGYWDPSYQIRNEIMKNLQAIGGKDVDLKALIANGEWIGKEIEEEIERVRREEQRYFDDRDRLPRRGVAIGVGVGF